jgi:PAS domain S-box-containing protein
MGFFCFWTHWRNFKMTEKPTYEALEKRVKELSKEAAKRKRVEKTLKENKARFNIAQKIACVGSWDRNVQTGEGYWSDEQYRLYGYEPEEVEATHELFREHIHPDDRQLVIKTIEDAFKGYKPFDIEFRFLRKDGTIRFAHSKGEVEWNKTGRPLRISGTFQDITERKRLEEVLKENEERFRSTFEQAAIGIAHVSPEGHFLRVNQRFCDIVGYTNEEMLAHTFQDITHPDDLNNDLEFIRQVLSGEIQTYSLEKRYFKKNGSIVWVNLTVSLIRKSSGEPKYFISAIENITKQKQAEKALQKAHDEMKKQTIELEIKTKNLVELNTAMEVLLKKRKEDKIEIEDSVLTNVKELIEPYFSKMRKTKLDEQQNAFLDIMESNLIEITNPFARRMSTKYLNLTPTEIQVANMIKHGNSSKKIAGILNISTRTVDTHRKNIRRKIGLNQKRTNLRSYLLSLH